MKLWIALLTTIIAFLMAIPAQAETIYKWADDEGIIQYTGSAPKDRDYTVLDIHGGMPSGAEEASVKLEQRRAGKFQAEEKAEEYTQQQRERDKQATVRKENCDNAKRNLKVMQENSRIRLLGDDGKFRYINDGERLQHIDRATAIISENCSD